MDNIKSANGQSEAQASSKNFWSTLPGILGGVIGLIGATTTFVTVTSSLLNKPQTYSINVSAKSVQGMSFLNEKSVPVKVDFQSKGQWSAIPETETGIAQKGYTTADGYPDFANSNRDRLPCPAFPLGALVVKVYSPGSPAGKCVVSGKKGMFDLSPSERANFLMNDVDARYEDNDGQLEVILTVSKK